MVESSGSSTTFHVCKVASGANETLRFAGGHVSSAITRINVHLPSDFLLASLFASISCRSRSFAAACCSSSLRTAIRVGDRTGERGLEAPGVGEVSNGLGKPCVAFSASFLAGDFRGDFSGVCRPLALPGELLRARLWGGIAFGGDNAIVGFKIDLTWGGSAGCDRSAFDFP